MYSHTTLQFLRRWLLLLLIGPLVGGVAGYLVARAVPSVYSADVTLLVQRGDTTTALAAGQDAQVSGDVAQTYAEAMITRSVLTEAAARVGLGSLSFGELQNRVHARRVTNTQLLRVSAEDTNPALAADLANAVADVFANRNAAAQASRFNASRDNLARLVDQLQADIDDRNRQIADLQAQPSSPEHDLQLGRLQSDLTQLEATHSQTVRSYEDLRVGEARSANTLTVLDAAAPPESPIRPNRLLTTLAAVLAGLLAAAGLALIAEHFDDRLRDGERLTAATGLGVLVIVPRGSAKSVRLRDPKGGRVTESYRLLRSNLLYATAGTPLHVVLVASAALGEGKTTTAGHLAVVLAESGQRVILVDADLHRPAVAQLFGLPNRVGLSTLLVDEQAAIADVLRPTWLPTLHVLPAGPTLAETSGLVLSRRLEDVLTDLRAACDIVVLDTPPLLTRPDAVLLSTHADAVLFVINPAQTRGRHAAGALHMLRRAGAPVVGAVVNGARPGSADFGAFESHRGEYTTANRPSPRANGHDGATSPTAFADVGPPEARPE